MAKKVINSNPPTVKAATGLPVVVGVLMGFGLFLLLPITQWIDAMREKSFLQIDSVMITPPPPVMDLDEPEPEPEEEEEIEELKEPPPPPTLDQLELSLNADMSGLMGGDIVLPSFDVAGDLESMIYDIAELDQQPRAVVQTTPIYPLDLQRAGIGGTVVVEFVVTATGSVTSPFIVSSSNPGFNDAVLKAVRSWKFEPGMKENRKVNTRVRVPIPFKVSR